MPRVYISSPLDALRTFNLASICWCREVFQSVLACTRSKARRTSSILACTRSKARRTFSCLHSLKGEEDFFLPALAQSRGGLFLACTRSKSRRTFSCLHSLKVEEDFLWCLNLPGAYISSPLDELRTFSLSRLRSLIGEEVFYSFSPALARGRGGRLLFLAFARS